MLKLLKSIVEWVKKDWQSNPFRFMVEIMAWCLSVSGSLILAVTAPNPPMFILYPVWISGCALYCWASFTRKSFGLVANYVLLTFIDSVGLLRLLL